MSTLSSFEDQVHLLGSSAPFFRSLEFPAAEKTNYAGCIAEIRSGQLTGIVIRGVYDPDFMSDVAARLEQHDPPFLKTSFPEKFRSWFYGRNLNLMGTDPATYFQQAQQFHDQLSLLFAEEQSFQNRILDLLSSLDEDRPYSAAPGPDVGLDYMVTTLRGHAEGGYIAAHCDNEQSVRPAFEHLSTLVSDHMYSMVLMIQPSLGGGDLRVYDHRVESAEVRDGEVDQTGAHAGKLDLESLSSATISLQPGDIVIVDSGRYLHQVTPVLGPVHRWVACSFMAHSLDRNAVYTWG